MNLKMTFTIPEDIAVKLRKDVAERQRSAFVSAAVRDKLQALETKELERRLIQGYIETREEDRLINEEWEAATLEGWPEY